MANVSWLIRRLKAMSIPEVLWRLSQKKIQNKEEKKYGEKKVSVIAEIFNPNLDSLVPNAENLHINYDNKEYGLNSIIHLLAGAKYEDYKKKWNAGFQTDNTWPDTFSYKLEYKQRDDIGDARTNWELNRHFQFALLAKNYAASNDEKYLSEFKELFADWNEKNSFLHGISWTSVMEVAIRCSNWCYSYAFLNHARADEELLNGLRIGIINMTDYIANHYSRYSSANNHLIVEAFAIGQSGILFDNKEWLDLSVTILTRELPLQNFSDGINKELSLHYQSFYIEAMGLMMRLMIKNNIELPATWKPMLTKMSQYMADCMGDYGEVVVFGDDDEGKILDLQGGEINHYEYVLGMMSLLLDKQYVDVKDIVSETLRWLFTDKELEQSKNKELYIIPQYCCYKEGGNSILRSKDRKVLIGIDHAALGFGSIAAHGHADALSFQLFYEGKPLFVDPGTYIYHCDIKSRNDFRKTQNHNTVTIENKDQSEMLGAFLWGRKARASLISEEKNEDKIELVMMHDGYSPIIHQRKIEFDGENNICFRDNVSAAVPAMMNFILAPNIESIFSEEGIILSHGEKVIAKMKFESKGNEIKTSKTSYSNKYGVKQTVDVLSCNFEKECSVVISMN